MIALTSNGLSSACLMTEMSKHIKKGKAALVVTADNVYKEKNYHVERLTNELQLMGLQVDCFDFDHQTPAELAEYDAVEIIGGNPYYLLHSIRENGYAPCLAEFAEDKILIGCSAGALVLTPTLNLIDLYSQEMNIVGLKDLTACHLTDIQLLPHYSKFLNHYDKFEEKCSQYEQENDCHVIRINDGEGIFVNGSEVTIVK
ncbi:MAG: hypothetical protein E7527_06925 [Ruminococcaceae bacterium]|nr:hypothetical protein [Oscillospiraceae bacterium]